LHGSSYRQIVINKTAYYTFYLSAACAMLLNGVTDDASHELAKKICVQIGEYFQIQDDFLDCYGDEKVIGKVGTDIQDNKCSWLVVQALGRASSEHKATLKQHYGRNDVQRAWPCCRVPQVRGRDVRADLAADRAGDGDAHGRVYHARQQDLQAQQVSEEISHGDACERDSRGSTWYSE